MKEKMERQLGLRAMVEVGEGVHRRNVDTEEHHDDEERSIRAQLEKLEEEIVSLHPDVDTSSAATGPEVQTEGEFGVNPHSDTQTRVGRSIHPREQSVRAGFHPVSL